MSDILTNKNKINLMELFAGCKLCDWGLRFISVSSNEIHLPVIKYQFYLFIFD